MRKHEKRCYQVESYINKCSYCDYKTFEKKRMTTHLKKCQSKSAKLYKCTKCDFKSSDDQVVTSHITKQHGQYSKCSFCSFQSPIFGTIRRHEKQCNGDRQNYTCPKCGEQMNFWHFQRHPKKCSMRQSQAKPKLTIKHLENRRHGKWIVKLTRLNL